MMSNGVYFCPTCNSPHVDVSSLVGGAGKCLSCGWSGTREEMTFSKIGESQTAPPSPEAIIRAFGEQLLLSLAKNFAGPLSLMLRDWGFLQTGNQEEVARYVRAAAGGAMKSIFEERIRLQAEMDKRAADAS
jgi:hypothetical protein